MRLHTLQARYQWCDVIMDARLITLSSATLLLCPCREECAKYYDEYMSVCLSVCVSAYISQKRKPHGRTSFNFVHVAGAASEASARWLHHRCALSNSHRLGHIVSVRYTLFFFTKITFYMQINWPRYQTETPTDGRTMVFRSHLHAIGLRTLWFKKSGPLLYFQFK